ncbi:MAG TPA: tRNA methyl transferase PRC-barrel domain-containing protein, partial [Acidimicrobiales bacterium]|nr:tRNA methyl transferase PRC-barrel domain-containing protein [Acidimicrobiales bacterium]
SDSGCCSVADVDDARLAAGRVGIDHHVFDFTELFESEVVAPYVEDHRRGRTPNPCIECNRQLKFGALLHRARRLGFDALATGHHARVMERAGRLRLLRGVDVAKDQSYVLSMLRADELARVALPVGHYTKDEVRDHARRLGMDCASKPDSQDVCFIEAAPGRRGFLADRVTLHPGELVDAESGAVVGHVPAVELITVGQRRGLGVAVDGRRRFALSIDVERGRVIVGHEDAVTARRVDLERVTWADDALEASSRALAQTSAHGAVAACSWEGTGVVFDTPQRLVAPGQTVALYDATDPDVVLGAGLAARR